MISEVTEHIFFMPIGMDFIFQQGATNISIMMPYFHLEHWDYVWLGEVTNHISIMPIGRGFTCSTKKDTNFSVMMPYFHLEHWDYVWLGEYGEVTNYEWESLHLTGNRGNSYYHLKLKQNFG